MQGRASRREFIVGLVMVAASIGFLAMLAMAGGGPAFLSQNRTIDVIFRDGQGIREGSPVRIAGIDSGHVTEINLIEFEGTIKARVRIALPNTLAIKLKQDVKVTIQPSLTGQSRVNIVSSGRSGVALVPGQLVQGVESTFFDPILEQVGLGPVERSHLSHTIAEIRKTVDTASPRIREILAALQETAGGLKDSSDALRPVVESTAQNLESLSKRISESSPKIDKTLTRLESVTTQVDTMLTENRANLQATMVSVRDLSATARDMSLKNREKVEKLLDGVELTRARADRVLYQADILAGQGVQMVTKNRADIERTLLNVKDATDWADKLVQKIYANPFVLSPLYKPSAEDVRASSVYDTAQVFTKGAQELNDLIKTLDSLQARMQTPAQQQEIAVLEKNILVVTEKLNQTSQLLAESLKRQPPPVRVRR